jgi:phage regulator Rha-like protein
MTRDGLSRLVFSFGGRAASEWIEKYIAAFNAMEAALRKPTPEAASEC